MRVFSASALTSLIALLLLGVGGCKRQNAIQVSSFAAQLRDEYGIDLSFTSTNTQVTVFTSSGKDKRKIILAKSIFNESMLRELRRQLATNNADLFEHSPIEYPAGKRRAIWWNPESFGKAEAFHIVAQRADDSVLDGFIFSGTNVVFFQLRIPSAR